MSNIKYNDRVWLNSEESHFTGSMVCFDGVIKNQGKPAERYTFVELRDCHGRIRLHVDKNSENELEEFRDKLLLLQETLDCFIDHLNKELTEERGKIVQELEKRNEVSLPAMSVKKSFIANFLLR
jgi:hypothetical protein